MRAILFVTLAPAMLIAGCNQPTADAPADPAAALAAIDAVEQGQASAINARDLAGATAVYADDARFFDAGSPAVSGSEAIKASFEGLLADENAALEITRATSWAAASGDLVVTQATYKFTTTGEDGQPVTVDGLNQTVWQKQPDGSWKIVSDFNAGTGGDGGATAAAE